MKPGDIVTIYRDPITQQGEEGKAKLIKKELDFRDGFEYWTVCFLEDAFEARRTIKAK